VNFWKLLSLYERVKSIESLCFLSTGMLIFSWLVNGFSFDNLCSTFSLRFFYFATNSCTLSFISLVSSSIGIAIFWSSGTTNFLSKLSCYRRSSFSCSYKFTYFCIFLTAFNALSSFSFCDMRFFFNSAICYLSYFCVNIKYCMAFCIIWQSLMNWGWASLVPFVSLSLV